MANSTTRHTEWLSTSLGSSHVLCLFVALALAGHARGSRDLRRRIQKPLFNGRDLTGWVRVNTAPSTFFVKDNEIITTGSPMGFLRTDKQYENFIAEFEWMHKPPKADAVGNSGFFVWCDPLPAVGTGYTRGIEVQVLVNLTYTDKKTGAITATSQGDLFSIHGATLHAAISPHPARLGTVPAEREPGEGRRRVEPLSKVIANDGAIKLEVNGKEVSRRQQMPPTEGLCYPRPRIRRGRVPLPQPEDQGTAEHEPEAGGVRNRR